ncbi:hypothetical protein GOBAR_AA18505 [Gossypium barbadense]|uniref:Pentacotripeptide-repeat region of PRORP domain-containing protein n=1 Tax=Gossypium barbadense TaxID=3634 RepID=A0A2P5XFS7_GOSBA|nr:hypothetical protein GOBAR_AA18505 [Gossypium barbadense]
MTGHRSRGLPNFSTKITQRIKSSPTKISATLFHRNSSHDDTVEPSAENDHVLVSWTSKLSKLVKQGQPEEAICLFKRMLLLKSNQRPNYVTILSLIKALDALHWDVLVMMVHGLVVKMGFISEPAVLTALIGSYSVYGMGTCWSLFHQIPDKDVVLWSAVVSACVKNKDYLEALELFRRMQFIGLKVNHVSIVSILPSCANLGALRLGREIHGFIIKRMFSHVISVQNSLVDMYAKCRNLESGIRVFDGMLEKDLVSWRTVIRGYVENECGIEATNIFSKMQLLSFFAPDEFVVRDMIMAVLQSGENKLGSAFHCYILKNGFLAFVSVATALLQMYAKFGMIRKGQARNGSFDEVPIKDLICWSSLINGYGLNGYGIEALETFSNMLDCGIKPNEIIFLSVLSACSHCGLEYEGWNWFYSMKEKYNVTPKLAHYACMVDLLSRQGNIEQALDFVKKMPMEPDKRIWGAILAGCRLTPGPIENVEFVVEQLATLDPQNSTNYYTILSDLYASEGREEDVERMRRLVENA